MCTSGVESWYIAVPTLYTWFAKLSSHLDSRPFCWRYESYCGATYHDIEMKLDQDLCNVRHWLLANKWAFNVNKTEYIIIGSRQKLSQLINETVLTIGSENISRVSSTKTLGVIVDERITWRDQIEKRQRKLQKELAY